jgi:hypothetical protein
MDPNALDLGCGQQLNIIIIIIIIIIMAISSPLCDFLFGFYLLFCFGVHSIRRSRSACSPFHLQFQL